MESLAINVSDWIDQAENFTDFKPAFTCDNNSENLPTNSIALCSTSDNNLSTNISGINESDFPFSLWQTTIIAFLISLCSLVTISGNVLVLTAFALERTIRQPSNYFICSLAVSDFAIGLVSMPIFGKYMLQGHWNFGPFMCDLWLATDHTVCLVSIYTVLFITIDRYCSVKIAAKYRYWRSKRKVLAMVAITWIIPCAVFFITILGWEHFTGRRDLSPGECVVQFLKDPVFNASLIFVYFFATLVVLFFLYGGIYATARQMQKRADLKQKRLQSFAKNRLTSDKIVKSYGLPLAKQAHEERLILSGNPNVLIPSKDDTEKEDANKAEEVITSFTNCREELLERDTSSSPQFDSDEEADEKKESDTAIYDIAHASRNMSEPLIKSAISNRSVRRSLQNNVRLLSQGKKSRDKEKHKASGSGACKQNRQHRTPSDCILMQSSCYSTRNSSKAEKEIQNASYTNEPRDEEFNIPFTQDEIEPKRTIPFESGSRDTQQCSIGELSDLSQKTYVGLFRNVGRQRSTDETTLNDGLNDNSQSGPDCLPIQVSQLEDVSEKTALYQTAPSEENLSVNAEISSFWASVKSSIKRKKNLFPSVRMKAKAESRKTNESRRKSRGENRARKALRTISFIMGAFVLCWTPYHVCALVEGFCRNPDGCVNSRLFYFTYFLCYANSPINPFCYAMANKQFKNTFSRILKGDFHKN